MSPDEMQRTMQFLVEHQAQFAADFEKLSAKVDGLADSVKETREAVNGLTTVVGHTVGLMGELTREDGPSRRTGPAHRRATRPAGGAVRSSFA
jgi:archaellum component FlaC